MDRVEWKVFTLHCNGINLTFYNMIRPQTITQRALTRLLRYWNSRRKVFGDDYILPLTLYGM